MMPSLFLSHGSPMLAVEDNEYTRFLGEYGRRNRPRAVVVLTAHWEEPVVTVTCTDSVYGTIHDFGGFPDKLYAIRYPARGSSTTAAEVRRLLKEGGIPSREDETRGLDHGSWVLLSRLYPQADIPVVQVSVNPALPASGQFRIGECLRPLGREGVLVLGSGATVHNLFRLRFGQSEPEAWAVAFDDWLIEKIGMRDTASLFAYNREAPNARLAVPRPEHFVPLLIAMGSADPGAGAKVVYRGYDLGSLSYLGFQFGP